LPTIAVGNFDELKFLATNAGKIAFHLSLTNNAAKVGGEAYGEAVVVEAMIRRQPDRAGLLDPFRRRRRLSASHWPNRLRTMHRRFQRCSHFEDETRLPILSARTRNEINPHAAAITGC
jgi:hypothetical protein